MSAIKSVQRLKRMVKKRETERERREKKQMFLVFLGVYAFLFGFSREFKFDNTPDNHCQSHRFDEFKSAFRNFSLNALFLYA